MRINRATMRGRSLLASTVIWGLCAIGCMKTYRAPALPANQLALVTLDSSARALEVDGLPLPSARGGDSANQFFVGVGCRQLTVKYEQSYFIWGEKKAKRAGLGTGLAATLANTEQHDYETMKPIRFLVPATAGRKYWVTATFTGDEFLPRIVESDPSGDTVRRFLPDEPCQGASGAPPAALPAPSNAQDHPNAAP
jgi:hypothetical protein